MKESKRAIGENLEEGKRTEKWYNYIVTSKINLGKVDHEMFLNNAIVSVFF